MQIDWRILQLDCLPNVDGQQDYVVTVHWQCAGNDDGFDAIVYANCSFSVTAGTDFIPYNELTQDIVLGWIWNNGVDKDETEARVIAQIELQKNPPIVSPPLPWASA